MRRPRHWFAACAVIALAVTGCSGSSGSSGAHASGATGDLVSAVSALSSASALTTTIRLDATPAALQTLAHAGNATLDAGTARAVAQASIVIERTKTGDSSSFDVRVVDGSKTLIELRSIGGSLYLQGDVRGILTLVHKQKVFASLRAETKSMPSFVRAAIGGQWVSLPTSALSSFAQAGGTGSASASGGIKLFNELSDVIKRDVTVASAGSDARGQRYQLTGDEQALGRDLATAITDSIPGGGFLGQRIPSTSLKHRSIHLDAWVNGGALAALSLDLTQFGDPGTVPAGTTLPLVVSFARSGAPISAPTGAVPVDLTQLGTLIGALTGGGGA